MTTLLLEHLGALPELEEFGCSQQWQDSGSFSDLELTGSGSATSWLGCDLLMDVEEEFSSKLLSQEFVAAPQPVPALVPQPAAAPVTTISGYSSAGSLYSGCCPYGAPFTAARAQGVPAMPAVAAPVLPVPTPVSPATSGSHQLSSLCDATAVAPLLAVSRAASPEPDWHDEEAVRLAGLALQLSQGDASQAMSHLLAWAAAH